MQDKINVRFRRITRYNNISEWYHMYTRTGALTHEKTFPKFGAPEPTGLGPHGTVITQTSQIRLGLLTTTLDPDDMLHILLVLEGRLETDERSVIVWNVSNLLGLNEMQEWDITVMENCKETFFLHPYNDGNDERDE